MQGRAALAPATRPEDGPRVWLDLSVDDQPRGRIEASFQSQPQTCPVCQSCSKGGRLFCLCSASSCQTLIAVHDDWYASRLLESAGSKLC